MYDHACVNPNGSDIERQELSLPFLVVFRITIIVSNNYCQYWQELWLGFKKLVGDNNCHILSISKMVYIYCEFGQLLSN